MMYRFIEIASTVLQSFLIIWFVSEFCGYKYKKRNRYLCFALFWVTDCAIMIVLNGYKPHSCVLYAVTVLEYCLYSHICLRKNWFSHVVSVVFAVSAVFALSNLFSLLVLNVQNITLFNLYGENSVLSNILFILCIVAEFAVFKFILHLNGAYKLSKDEWLLFALFAGITCIEVALFNYVTTVSKGIEIYMLAASVLGVAVNVCLYFLILKINRSSKHKTDFLIMKMQYDSAKETENNLKSFYDRYYDLKQDVGRDFIAIKSIAKQQNDKNVVDYIDRMTDKSYGNHSVFTENPILNSILNVRMEICNIKKINTSIQIEKNSINNIDDMDLIILFSNILDSAIEAADELSGADKTINLNVQKQGDYVSIYIENSTDKIFNSALKIRKRVKNKHEFEMENVKRIVDKYNGMMKCFEGKNMFCCDILIMG